MKKEQNKTNTALNEVEKIQQRIFEREVDEELQQEKLMQFWQKYRFVIIGGISAVLLATIGYEVHRSWWQKVRLGESDQYENALLSAYTGKPEEAITQLKLLSEEGKTGYQYLAQMEAAGILLASNRQDEALSILSALASNEKAPIQLRHTATLAVVGHQLESGDASKLQSMLQPMMRSDNDFSVLAAELSALLYIRENQAEKAIQVLEEALNKQISSQTKQRLNGLLMEIRS